MIKVNWDVEELVALIDLEFQECVIYLGCVEP